MLEDSISALIAAAANWLKFNYTANFFFIPLLLYTPLKNFFPFLDNQHPPPDQYKATRTHLPLPLRNQFKCPLRHSRSWRQRPPVKKKKKSRGTNLLQGKLKRRSQLHLYRMQGLRINYSTEEESERRRLSLFWHPELTFLAASQLIEMTCDLVSIIIAMLHWVLQQTHNKPNIYTRKRRVY